MINSLTHSDTLILCLLSLHILAYNDTTPMNIYLFYHCLFEVDIPWRELCTKAIAPSLFEEAVEDGYYFESKAVSCTFCLFALRRYLT